MQVQQCIVVHTLRERERTVLVGDLDVEEEESEGGGVGANDLTESPFESSFAADGSMQ